VFSLSWPQDAYRSDDILQTLPAFCFSSIHLSVCLPLNPQRKREARYQTGHSSTPPLPIPEISGERGNVQMKENLHVAISHSLQKQTDPKTSRGGDKGNEEEG